MKNINIIAYIVGTICILIFIFLLVYSALLDKEFPSSTTNMITILFPIACSSFAIGLTGELRTRFEPKKNFFIQASGAIGIFVITFFFNPTGNFIPTEIKNAKSESKLVDKIKKVDIGVSDEFIKENLGISPVIDRTITIGLENKLEDGSIEIKEKEFRKQLYNCTDFFLYTLSRNNSVLVYSVTITQPKCYVYIPARLMNNKEGWLGKITLADISPEEPTKQEDIWMNQSSKFSEYFEKKYFGFSGNYHTYIFGTMDLGYQFYYSVEDSNKFFHMKFDDKSIEKRNNLRKEFKPNTFGVVANGIDLAFISDITVDFYEALNIIGYGKATYNN